MQGDRATTVRLSVWPSVPAHPRRALRTVVLRKYCFINGAVAPELIIRFCWAVDKVGAFFDLNNILFSRVNVTETTFP